MKINIDPLCEITPQQQRIKELTVLFASYEVEQLKTNFASDIVWHLVSDQPIKGKDNFANALLQMKGNKVKALTIHHIITHRKTAAIHGIMNMKDGNAYGFSDFYEFESDELAKIKSITSYVLKL